MFLMLWVNDFWTLKDIPKWLKHAGPEDDYLGFSDIIFPWFLFVMGMSIPFSIENRIKMDQKKYDIYKHVFYRSAALLTMGLFHMNMEMYNNDLSILSKPVFVITSTTAFFMIWNNSKIKSRLSQSLSFLGIFILVIMYSIFIGKDYNGDAIGFGIHWWGILGLIGWTYVIAAPAYLIFRKSLRSFLIILFFCMILNIFSSAGISYGIFSWQKPNSLPGGGGLHLLTFAGIINSIFLMRFMENHNKKKLYLSIIFMIICSLILGIIFREFFIISKIKGTISWILLSLSSAFLFFLLLHWIVDVKRYLSWYHPISVAGVATLTCYLVPYFYYNFNSIFGINIPVVFSTGVLGLIKSVIYSYIIILITRGLKTINIELKI